MKYLIIICLLLSACSVEKRAAKKVNWLLAYDKLSEACARIYPSKDSTIVKDTTIYDTVEIDNEVFIRDTIIKDGKTVYVEKKCPPHQVITKTVTRDSIVYRRSTSEEARLTSVINNQQKVIAEKDKIIIEKDKKIDKNDWWKMAALITWFIILLSIIFRLFIYKKPI